MSSDLTVTVVGLKIPVEVHTTVGRNGNAKRTSCIRRRDNEQRGHLLRILAVCLLGRSLLPPGLDATAMSVMVVKLWVANPIMTIGSAGRSLAHDLVLIGRYETNDHERN